jgi:hypothetical protein
MITAEVSWTEEEPFSEWDTADMRSIPHGLVGWKRVHRESRWDAESHAPSKVPIADLNIESLAHLIVVGSIVQTADRVVSAWPEAQEIHFTPEALSTIRHAAADYLAWDWQSCSHGLTRRTDPKRVAFPQDLDPDLVEEHQVGTQVSLLSLIRKAFAVPRSFRLRASLIAFYFCGLSTSVGSLVWFVRQVTATSSRFTPSEAIFGAFGAFALSVELLLGALADMRQESPNARPRAN